MLKFAWAKKNQKKLELWDLAHVEAETLGTSHRTPSRKHWCFLCLPKKFTVTHQNPCGKKRFRHAIFSTRKKKLNAKLSAFKNCPTVAAWKTEWRLGTPHPNPAHSPPKWVLLCLWSSLFPLTFSCGTLANRFETSNMENLVKTCMFFKRIRKMDTLKQLEFLK